MVFKSPGNIRTVNYIEKLKKNIPKEGNGRSLPYCCKLHGCLQEKCQVHLKGKRMFYTLKQHHKIGREYSGLGFPIGKFSNPTLIYIKAKGFNTSDEKEPIFYLSNQSHCQSVLIIKFNII